MNLFKRVLTALAFLLAIASGLFTTVTAIASQSERHATTLDDESGDDVFDYYGDEGDDEGGNGEDEWKEEDEDEE